MRGKTIIVMTVLAFSAVPAGSVYVYKGEWGKSGSGNVKLAVYDLSGRRVATLADGAYAAGEHVVCWQADVPTGVYIYRLEAGGKAATKKVVVAK